jgi:hypothetical protein
VPIVVRTKETSLRGYQFLGKQITLRVTQKIVIGDEIEVSISCSERKGIKARTTVLHVNAPRHIPIRVVPQGFKPDHHPIQEQ